MRRGWRSAIEAEVTRALTSTDVDVAELVSARLAQGRTPSDVAGELRERLLLPPSTSRELVGRLLAHVAPAAPVAPAAMTA